MDIKTNRLAYQFDDQGNTESVQIAFNGNETPNYINATIQIDKDSLADGQTFDDLSKKEIEAIGRKKLSDMTVVDEETQTE